MSTDTQQQTQYTKGQTWGALKKAWTGYRVAKIRVAQGREDEKPKMREYAEKIRKLQGELGVKQASFPDLGLN